jgi:hypothetical protein
MYDSHVRLPSNIAPRSTVRRTVWKLGSRSQNDAPIRVNLWWNKPRVSVQQSRRCSLALAQNALLERNVACSTIGSRKSELVLNAYKDISELELQS